MSNSAGFGNNQSVTGLSVIVLGTAAEKLLGSWQYDRGFREHLLSGSVPSSVTEQRRTLPQDRTSHCRGKIRAALSQSWHLTELVHFVNVWYLRCLLFVGLESSSYKALL